MEFISLPYLIPHAGLWRFCRELFYKKQALTSTLLCITAYFTFAVTIKCGYKYQREECRKSHKE